MKPYAHFGDVARVRVTDEAALAEVITGCPNAGAGIDVTTDELPAAHPPPCGIEHVATTPHTAGETRRYDDNMIEILRGDLAAFAAAQSNDGTGLSGAYRGQRRTQPYARTPRSRKATQRAQASVRLSATSREAG